METYDLIFIIFFAFLLCIIAIVKLIRRIESRQEKSDSQDGSTQYSSNQSGSSTPIAPEEFAQKLQTLSDSQDVQPSITAEQQQLVQEARQYKQQRRNTYRTTTELLTLDLSWSENLAELLEQTEVIYTNAELNGRMHLDSRRFDYYRNLHYRSFTAADLCHSKYLEVLSCYLQAKALLPQLKDKNDPSYNQLSRLKDGTYRLYTQLRKRRDDLNDQTRLIKGKIRDECGQRGQEWYARLEAKKYERMR